MEKKNSSWWDIIGMLQARLIIYMHAPIAGLWEAYKIDLVSGYNPMQTFMHVTGVVVVNITCIYAYTGSWYHVLVYHHCCMSLALMEDQAKSFQFMGLHNVEDKSVDMDLFLTWKFQIILVSPESLGIKGAESCRCSHYTWKWVRSLYACICTCNPGSDPKLHKL